MNCGLEQKSSLQKSDRLEVTRQEARKARVALNKALPSVGRLVSSGPSHVLRHHAEALGLSLSAFTSSPSPRGSAFLGYKGPHSMGEGSRLNDNGCCIRIRNGSRHLCEHTGLHHNSGSSTNYHHLHFTGPKRLSQIIQLLKARATVFI